VPQDELAEFDQLFVELTGRARRGRFEPNIDVYIDDDGVSVIVDVEIAGADADNLRVGVDARHLYILGRRIERRRASRGTLLQKEIFYGEFAKKLHLPVAVRYEDATATYRDGILTIRLPIAPTRHIPTHRAEIRMHVTRTIH
jgi:HSP20 family protein